MQIILIITGIYVWSQIFIYLWSIHALVWPKSSPPLGFEPRSPAWEVDDLPKFWSIQFGHQCRKNQFPPPLIVANKNWTSSFAKKPRIYTPNPTCLTYKILKIEVWKKHNLPSSPEKKITPFWVKQKHSPPPLKLLLPKRSLIIGTYKSTVDFSVSFSYDKRLWL